MKLRILEVIRQGEVGGGESHVIDLTLGLRRRQAVEPVVLAFTDGHMTELLREAGVACFVINSHRAFDPRVFGRIEELVAGEHIDIIHAHGSRAASNMWAVAHCLHLPMVYTVHGWSFHAGQSPLAAWMRRQAERMLCRQAARVVCVSQSNRQTGIDAFGLEADKSVVIENGVNLQRFDPDAPRPDLRPQLGFAPTDFVCLFMCRITAQKAPLDFVRAVAAAHGRDSRVRGLMVGQGDMDAEVEACIAREVPPGVIVRQPFRADVPELLAMADVFCLPSLWEGLSVAMLEAMAMRKAVVVTLTDGARDIIRHRHNALVVPPADAGRMAEAIVEAATQPELCQRMGQRAAALVRQRFDSNRVAEQVEQIYLDIAR